MIGSFTAFEARAHHPYGCGEEKKSNMRKPDVVHMKGPAWARRSLSFSSSSGSSGRELDGQCQSWWWSQCIHYTLTMWNRQGFSSTERRQNVSSGHGVTLRTFRVRLCPWRRKQGEHFSDLAIQIVLVLAYLEGSLKSHLFSLLDYVVSQPRD